jgi:membrane peptidoglycan carboxypeptidase
MSGSYSPGNAEGNEQGSMTLQHATSHSVNTAFLELAAQVGVCNEKKTMAELGLHTSQNGDYGDPNKDGLFGDQGPAGVILGADNASPLTLAASYATLAAGGTYCEPVPVESITSFEGKKYAIASKGCKKVVSGDVAYDATRILQTVFQGTARRVGGVPGRPSAGKTGTSDSSKQTWFAGYTPQRSAAVWYGTPVKPRAMPGIYGATVAGPLWRSVMASASEGLPVERFQRVKDQFTDPNATEVPDVTGRSEGTARRILEEAGFSVRIGYRMYSTYVSFGRVVSTDPGAQASSQKGSTVTLHLSRGKRPEPTRTPSPSATPSPSTPAKPTPSKTATPAAPPAAG